MPDQGNPPGGQGEDTEPPKRSELRLIEQALRQDWPIPPPVKRRILQRMINLVDCDPDPSTQAAEDPDDPPIVGPSEPVSPRTAIAATRVIAALCNLSIKQQALDLARKRVEGEPDKLTLDQLTQEAESRALQRLAERATDEPLG